jgi:hypothetical protein
VSAQCSALTSQKITDPVFIELKPRTAGAPLHAYLMREWLGAGLRACVYRKLPPSLSSPMREHVHDTPSCLLPPPSTPCLCSSDVCQAATLGILSGLVSSLFSWGMHTGGTFFKWLFKQRPYLLLRPVVGGVVVIALRYAVGSDEYLGLGAYAK